MPQTLCELCSSESEVAPFSEELDALICTECRDRIEQPKLQAHHWHCLGESMWSEKSSVKVVIWRILNRLRDEAWAQDLLDQLYLSDEEMKLAQEESDPAEDTTSESTRDSNGTALSNGDSVTLVKDLDVKGMNFTAKRGTLVKNIVLTGDPSHVEGRVNGTTIVLKTMFLKKA